MTRYKVLAVTTRYWRPGDDYLEEILKSVKGILADADFVVVSEKAISTASGNIADERKVESTFDARFIASVWMHMVWGYFLGPVCHLQKRLTQQLRDYPSEMGSRHKQLALEHAGLLQALMLGSEGGIDGSNLPYSYVSLPLENPDLIAQRICNRIWSVLKKKTFVIIADTDRTYSFRNFHFTPRPKPIRGIHSLGGFFAYVVGRAFQLERRATPLALTGVKIPVEEALRIAEIANRARGFGAGRTVWDMADMFRVDLASVSWEMLDTVRHKPIVIVRTKQ